MNRVKLILKFSLPMLLVVLMFSMNISFAQDANLKAATGAVCRIEGGKAELNEWRELANALNEVLGNVSSAMEDEGLVSGDSGASDASGDAGEAPTGDKLDEYIKILKEIESGVGEINVGLVSARKNIAACAANELGGQLEGLQEILDSTQAQMEAIQSRLAGIYAELEIGHTFPDEPEGEPVAVELANTSYELDFSSGKWGDANRYGAKGSFDARIAQIRADIHKANENGVKPILVLNAQADETRAKSGNAVKLRREVVLAELNGLNFEIFDLKGVAVDEEDQFTAGMALSKHSNLNYFPQESMSERTGTKKVLSIEDEKHYTCPSCDGRNYYRKNGQWYHHKAGWMPDSKVDRNNSEFATFWEELQDPDLVPEAYTNKSVNIGPGANPSLRKIEAYVIVK